MHFPSFNSHLKPKKLNPVDRWSFVILSISILLMHIFSAIFIASGLLNQSWVMHFICYIFSSIILFIAFSVHLYPPQQLKWLKYDFNLMLLSTSVLSWLLAFISNDTRIISLFIWIALYPIYSGRISMLLYFFHALIAVFGNFLIYYYYINDHYLSDIDIASFIGFILLSFYFGLHSSNIRNRDSFAISTLSELEKITQKLEYLANYDSLTGVLTRNGLQSHANSVLSAEQVGFILLDIDYFKYYNDCYGHLEGDNCLKLLGKQFKSYITIPDVLVARLGGEEFCLLMRVISKKAVTDFAVKLQNDIQSLGVPHAASLVAKQVTVSMGVVYSNAEDKELDTLYKQADKALYLAKQQGRNRFVSAE